MRLSKTIGLPFYSSRDKQSDSICGVKKFALKWSTQSLPPFQLPVDNLINCEVNLVAQDGIKTSIDVQEVRDSNGQEHIIYYGAAMVNPVGCYDIEVLCDNFECYSEKIQLCDECYIDIPGLKIANCGITKPCCNLVEAILSNNPIRVDYAAENAVTSISASNFINVLVQQYGAQASAGIFDIKDKDGNSIPYTVGFGVFNYTNPQPDQYPVTFCAELGYNVLCEGELRPVTLFFEYEMPYSQNNEVYLIDEPKSCESDFTIEGLIIDACDFLGGVLIDESISYTILGGTQLVQGSTVTIPTDDLSSFILVRTIETDCNGVTTKRYRLEFDVSDPCSSIKLTEL